MMGKYLKKLEKAYKSSYNYWGVNPIANLEYLLEQMENRGFTKPVFQRAHIGLHKIVNDSLRVYLGIYTEGAKFFSNGERLTSFDARPVVWSKSINEVSEGCVWHNPSRKKDFFYDHAFCIWYRLVHFKEAEAPCDEVPSYAFTMDTTIKNNIHVFLEDFDRLILPKLNAITDDATLEQAIVETLTYKKSSWCKTDGPAYTWGHEQLQIWRERRKK